MIKSMKYGRGFAFDQGKMCRFINKHSFPNEAKMKKEQQKEKGDIYTLCFRGKSNLQSLSVKWSRGMRESKGLRLPAGPSCGSALVRSVRSLSSERDGGAPPGSESSNG